MYAEVEEQVPSLYVSLPQQLIHGDMDQHNILMDGTRVTGMLDLEFSGRDLRIVDLLVPLTWWPLALFGSGAEWAVLDALGQGYTSCLPLRADELEALPLLFRLRIIGGLLNRVTRVLRGHGTEQQVIERVAYTLERERWLQSNEKQLRLLTQTWKQER
jgi:homoserine kinase type II